LVKAERLIHRLCLRHHGQRGAVMGRDFVEIVERGEPAAARHVHRHRGRIARDVADDVARQEPQIEIVVAARRRADNHLELLAAVEIGDWVGECDVRCRDGEDQREEAAYPHDFHLARFVAESARRPHIDASVSAAALAALPRACVHVLSACKQALPQRQLWHSRAGGLAMARSIAAIAALTGLLAGPPFAHAEYPDHPTRIVVPYTPGGTVDVLARLLGPRLTEVWGQPVVVENRPGAGGNIGADFVAKSPPDGYTLFLSTNAPLTINVAAYQNIKYDPLRDFTPITVAGENAVLLVANQSLPATSIKELIELAKAKPGELSAGTSGLGTTAHLSLALFNKLAGVEIRHIPYRGGVPSLTAAVANEVPMTFSDIVPSTPLVRDGRLKGL